MSCCMSGAWWVCSLQSWILLLTFTDGRSLTPPTTTITITSPATPVDVGGEQSRLMVTSTPEDDDRHPDYLTPTTQPPVSHQSATTQPLVNHHSAATQPSHRQTKKPVYVSTTTSAQGQDDIITYQQALEYLVRYNYLSAETWPLNKTGHLYRQNDINSALTHFQWFMGLNQTGVLDAASVQMMSRPRCGLPDVERPKLSAGADKRGRRYADSGFRWNRTDLRYKIAVYTDDLARPVVRAEIKQAFDLWAEVTPLKFTRVTDNSEHIRLEFRTLDHGDAIPFDGPGKILAHAFYPPWGDVHFDDDETWSASTPGEGVSLRMSAAHEIGHSLGLGHSKRSNSLMAPVYDYDAQTVHLYADDVYGIQAIYGSSNNGNFDGRPFCSDASIDAATVVGSTTYFFKGEEVYKLDKGMAAGFPRPISATWPSLPARIDAALHTVVNGNYYNYFFKGRQVWRYTGYWLSSGWNGALIGEKIPGLPDYINSIHRYPSNGRVYAFKGSLYYRLKRDMSRVDDGYPKDLNIWWKKSSDTSITHIDAAFDWPGNSNKVYFFVGGQYYRYNANRDKLDNDYPKSTARLWYECEIPLALSESVANLHGQLWQEQEQEQEQWQEQELASHGAAVSLAESSIQSLSLLLFCFLSTLSYQLEHACQRRL